MNFIVRLSYVFIIIGMTACTTIPRPPFLTHSNQAALSWQKRQYLLSHITYWQLKGKIAIVTAHKSGSAIVNWTENKQSFTISLLGPLGTSSLTLTGQPGYVTLNTADGKRYTAKSPEQLLVQEWKWHIPVSSLQFWVRGLPVPSIPSNSQFDHAHRLLSLTQQGWNIQFLNYMRIGKIDLPSRLSVSSPTITTKIVIYEWHIK